MKINPQPTPDRNDLAAYQLATAPRLRDPTNGMDQLAGKAARLHRLATRARKERRWKKEERYA